MKISLNMAKLLSPPIHPQFLPHLLGEVLNWKEIPHHHPAIQPPLTPDVVSSEVKSVKPFSNLGILQGIAFIGTAAAVLILWIYVVPLKMDILPFLIKRHTLRPSMFPLEWLENLDKFDI